MIRRAAFALVLIAASVAFLPPTTGSAAAAAATCQGEAVTITGSPGGTVAGTDGDDVIESNGAATIDALAGDDTICVDGTQTSGASYVSLDAGPGDDVVHASTPLDGRGRPINVRATLGEGSDTYVGGPGRDFVDGGPAELDGEPTDTDHDTDTISTGAGGDSVVSGSVGEQNDDAITLGAGDDQLSWSGIPGSGSIDGGAGHDSVRVTTQHGRLTIDNVQHLLADGSDDEPSRGNESWSIIGDTRVDFVGSPADESLVATGALTARMGAGDDDVTASQASGTALGGAGDDTLTLIARSSQRGAIDLATGRATTGAHAEIAFGATWRSVGADGFGDVSVTGSDRSDTVDLSACQAEADLRGGADRLTFRPDTLASCRHLSRSLVARGGAGDDTISSTAPAADVVSGGPGADTLSARGGDNRLSGGSGGDQLTGSGLLRGNGGPDHLDGRAPTDDTLIGGGGFDHADGRGGTDTCRAERATSCEA